MRTVEKLFRCLIVLRWGASSVEHDIITDYLDAARPDYRGAWRAWLALSRARRAPSVMHERAPMYSRNPWIKSNSLY
jgi:hypothetical protein